MKAELICARQYPANELVMVALGQDGQLQIVKTKMPIFADVSTDKGVTGNASHILTVEIVGNQFFDGCPCNCLVVLRGFYL